MKSGTVTYTMDKYYRRDLRLDGLVVRYLCFEESTCTGRVATECTKIEFDESVAIINMRTPQVSEVRTVKLVKLAHDILAQRS